MELLVVIGVIGIVVSLMLPAVQSAREAARRVTCENHLKQLGIALQNYETTFGAFPPSTTFSVSGSEQFRPILFGCAVGTRHATDTIGNDESL